MSERGHRGLKLENIHFSFVKETNKKNALDKTYKMKRVKKNTFILTRNSDIDSDMSVCGWC